MKPVRDNTLTNTIARELSSINFRKPSLDDASFKKMASVGTPEPEAPPTRIKVASTQGETFLKSAHALPRGRKVAQDGSIWAIETDDAGDEWLVRNFAETEVMSVLQDMI